MNVENKRVWRVTKFPSQIDLIKALFFPYHEDRNLGLIEKINLSEKIELTIECIFNDRTRSMKLEGLLVSASRAEPNHQDCCTYKDLWELNPLTYNIGLQPIRIGDNEISEEDRSRVSFGPISFDPDLEGQSQPTVTMNEWIGPRYNEGTIVVARENGYPRIGVIAESEKPKRTYKSIYMLYNPSKGTEYATPQGNILIREDDVPYSTVTALTREESLVLPEWFQHQCEPNYDEETNTFKVSFFESFARTLVPSN